MRKFKKSHLHQVRNDEHYRFCTDFIKLMNAPDVAVLKTKVLPQFEAFAALYNKEDEALKKIVKSDLTRRINDADRERDIVFRGLADANKTALSHFRPAVRESAIRIQIVLDTYGNLAQKPVAEETSAVANLLRELTENYAADTEATGLTDWIAELGRLNGAVERMMLDRYGETAARAGVAMKEIRSKVDEACHVLILCVEALSIMETGEVAAACSTFIGNLNAVIDRVNRLLARRGRPVSNDDPNNGDNGGDTPDNPDNPDDPGDNPDTPGDPDPDDPYDPNEGGL